MRIRQKGFANLDLELGLSFSQKLTNIKNCKIFLIKKID